MIIIAAVVCAIGVPATEIDILQQEYPYGCREIRIEFADVANTHQCMMFAQSPLAIAGDRSRVDNQYDTNSERVAKYRCLDTQHTELQPLKQDI